MRSCLLPLFRQQALECACALANCAEVNRGLASCCLGNDSDGNWEPGGKDWEQPAGGFEEQRGRLWLPLWILPWTARRVRSALHTGLSLFPTLTFAILLEHSASIKYTTNTFICSLATAAFSFPGKVVNWSLLTPAIHQPAASQNHDSGQDQAQQGGVGEAERGASRRAEVRPYPNPGSRLQRFMKQINQNHTVNFPRNQSKCRSTLRDEKHQQAGEIPPECSGVPSPQEAQIPGGCRQD